MPGPFQEQLTEEVLGFDVSMDEPELVHVRETVHNVAHEGESFVMACMNVFDGLHTAGVLCERFTQLCYAIKRNRSYVGMSSSKVPEAQAVSVSPH